jgi:Domain of unknown function (DUF4332)
MPPIENLLRVPPYHLGALERQGIFTTGLLLEVSETPTRRQYLADQIGADITDVMDWRDEALLLNLANFGPTEQQEFIQAGILGLTDLLALDLEEFRRRLALAAHYLGAEPPTDLMSEGWWEQAHTLREE